PKHTAILRTTGTRERSTPLSRISQSKPAFNKPKRKKKLSVLKTTSSGSKDIACLRKHPLEQLAKLTQQFKTNKHMRCKQPTSSSKGKITVSRDCCKVRTWHH